MFKGVRIVATTILLAAIVMTFVSAFILPTMLCIIFVIVSTISSAHLVVSGDGLHTSLR